MWDTVVVGAGPAGSITAYCLAREGHSVCLVDRESFPRHKPCGGGLPVHAVDLLDDLNIDLDNVVQHVTDRVRFLYEFQDPVRTDLSDAPVTMVDRGEFDSALAEAARQQGAKFLDGTAFVDLDIFSGECVVELEDRKLRTKYVVGADGANSQVGRSVGLMENQNCGVALDAEIEVPDEVHDREAGLATFNVNYVNQGYGWIFPKANHLSLGIGGYDKEFSYPEALQNYISRSLDDESVLDQDVYGHPLPYFHGETDVVRDRVALVGDAASMVDALSGEGIFYAMQGARILAETIDERMGRETSSLETYQDRLQETVFNELRWSSRLAGVFFKFPKKCYEHGVKRPEIVNWIKKVVVSESSYDEIYEKIWNEITSRVGDRVLSTIGLG